MSTVITAERLAEAVERLKLVPDYLTGPGGHRHNHPYEGEWRAANTLQAEDLSTLLASHAAQAERIEVLTAALQPFEQMCIVAERRAMVTFGTKVEDRTVIIESSGEAGQAIVRMKDFRAARSALTSPQGAR